MHQVSPSRDRQQNIVWPAIWSVLKLAIHTAGRLLSSVIYLFIRPAVGIASAIYDIYGDTCCSRFLGCVLRPMSHLRFLSRNKVAASNCACRTLRLCLINKKRSASLVGACLCDRVAVCDMHSCILQLVIVTDRYVPGNRRFAA